jgi:hypothetical protein
LLQTSAIRGAKQSTQFLKPSPRTSSTLHSAAGPRAPAAGLGEHCVAHGLRKAECRIMAENNCSAHETKSVSGHRTLKEVERYTDAVNNRRLAAQARAKVAAGKAVPLSVAL